MAPVIQHNTVQKGNPSSFSGARGWTCSDIVSHCSATTDLKKKKKSKQTNVFPLTSYWLYV